MFQEIKQTQFSYIENQGDLGKLYLDLKYKESLFVSILTRVMSTEQVAFREKKCLL